MFDTVTAAVISSAPELTGVDRARLPALITDAYVKVAVAKSLVRDELIQDDAFFSELRSIAASQEAIALSLESGNLRASAAYVSASAYRVIAEAFGTSAAERSLLKPQQVATQVVSMLLFLAADSAADAAEVAADLVVPDQHEYLPLIQALKRLGSGSPRSPLGGAGSIPLPETSSDPITIAAAIGYNQCNSVLSALLIKLVDSDAEWEAGRFGSIAATMAFDFEASMPHGARLTRSLIAGPWHLARLLDMAEPVVLASSTAAINPPQDVPSDDWRSLVSRVARSRPVLWRNHRAALEAGMLEPGMSAVLAFPTGAGKSTISELKIASAVLRGKNVVCLAPTLSLIDQMSRAIRRTLPDIRVTAQRDVDEELPVNQSEGQEVFVMTPETCLASLGLDVARFGDVGLVVFDEAHLMHVEGGALNRRAVDASLCFLTLVSRFPAADLLLISAMLENADELTEWLSALTGRPAIALDSPWKPTRQARGALIYRSEDLNDLRARLREGYESSTTQGAPVAIRRTMLARPYGFFSLQSTWETTDTRDYRLTPLLSTPIRLATGGNRRTNGEWWLTPNANHVAAQLASAAAASGLKTLVFTQQVTYTSSIAREIAELGTHRTQLTSSERELVDRAAQILGGEDALYLDVDDDAIAASAIPHHGLLLPDERRLHESLFRRTDGVPVLVATSTVAQGMNFPSEFVIIAGDRRFDADSNARMRLEAHELLNAAGRAGRAGAHSNALVLVIPGQVVGYDGARQMDAGWFQLQSAFSRSDQCVALTDPIGAVLNVGQLDDEPLLLEYLSRRIGRVGDQVVGPNMLRRSLAAFVAMASGDGQAFEARVDLLAAKIEADTSEAWQRQCALISGLPGPDIGYIAERLADTQGFLSDVTAWSHWLLDVVRERPTMVDQVLRVGSRSALTGAPEELGDWDSPGEEVIDAVRDLLPLWMAGATLKQIQAAGIERQLASEDQHLEFARKFVLRVVPDLAYLFSLPALILDQRSTFGLSPELADDDALRYLAQCVELGVDTISKARVLDNDRATTRHQAHGG